MSAATHRRRAGALACACGIGALLGVASGGVADADVGVESSNTGSEAAGVTRGGAERTIVRGPQSDAQPTRTRGRDDQTPPGAPERRTASAKAQRVATPDRSVSEFFTAAALRVDPFAAFLNNSAPRATFRQTGQSPLGTVTGTIEITDPDSAPVGIAVTRAPSQGTVALSGAGYTYTPDPLLAHRDIVDSFQVTVSDADSGFHLHGLEGLLNLLTLGLLGAAGHTTTTTVRVTVAPFNTAPTATVRIDPPDPGKATLTGAVLGVDANGDALTYAGTGQTPFGSVTVSATGEFTYTAISPVPVRDTFSVTVDDGHGGSAVIPVIINIGDDAPAVELSTFCGCTLMPADTVFHVDVSRLAVLPQSSTWTALLGGTLQTSWGRPPWQGSSGGMPVNVVGPDHPTETVVFNRGYSTSGPSIDERPYAIPDRPLVEGMPDVPAWDRHLLVFQEGTCVSQELYNVANGVELPAAGIQDALGNAVYAALWGSAWIAEAGVHVDMSSPYYPARGWANASRLPYLPLILRPDELERGTVDHMLGITIAKDRGTGHTWPARAGDGTGTNPDGVPMGTVFRLRGDFDITEFQPGTQAVLRALQQHGAVVFDSFAAGRDGANLLVMSNGWSGNEHFTVQDELNTIPLSAFEAVDVPSLAVDPALGWMIWVG